MRKKIENHPLTVGPLKDLEDGSGRHEVYQINIKDGYNCDGCSFLQEETLSRMVKRLKNIVKGNPY